MATSPIDWSDLRHFLAVARAGSTLGAARALGVNQTTVARRLDALEAATGLVLVERRQAGCMLTPAGLALLAKAEAVEAAAGAFEEAADAEARETAGAVRLTALEIYAVTILPPILRDLRAAHPELTILLDTSERPRDLAAGEADVALRVSHGGQLEEAPGLVGRRIADDPWTLYCSRDYAARHERPRTAADLARHPIIGGGGDKVWPRYRAWLLRHRLEGAVTMHHDSSVGLLAAIRSGAGLAVLPSFIADREGDLVQCLPPIAGDEAGLWLLTHERLRRQPRVRAVMDFLGGRLDRRARERPSLGEDAWAA